ncbi:MAG TPA: hypothetical protein VMP11_19955 [Verrucomicrobiae bacterium]|nr:hypothetical protein [Verrucomicrobiae bacterium]
MRTSSSRQWFSRTGFTLTELSVLVGVGALLSSLLLADLTQTRQKLLQQSCAANMKQWGVAMELYSQDWGVFYYDVGGLHFSDYGSPLYRYLGTTANADRYGLRACPARVAALPLSTFEGSTAVLNYEMPVGTYRRGLAYGSANSGSSPYYYGTSPCPCYWPNLKSCHDPAQLLLMIENNGHTTEAGGLFASVTTVVPTDADQVPAIYRHGGLINCLFGDLHVEAVTTNTLRAADAMGKGGPWFTLN